MTTYWPYIAAFLSPILAFLSAYIVIRINRKYTDGQKITDGEATWRQARLDAERALREDFQEQRRESQLRTLKFEGDFAAVAGILDRVAVLQERQITIAEQLKHVGRNQERYETELQSIHSDINTMRRDILQLTRDGAK